MPCLACLARLQMVARRISLCKAAAQAHLGLIVASVPLDQVPAEMSAEWQVCEQGGGIHVETQVGGGTTVKLYFRRVIGQYRPR